jgi:hypothetical protein
MLTTETIKQWRSDAENIARRSCEYETEYSAAEAILALTAELLANREAQPVAWLAIYHGEVYDEAISITRSVVEAQAERFGWESALTEIIPLYRHALPAPAVPAVPDKPRLPPHVYRDLLDMLQETAIAYGGTQQLRAQLSSALSIHVQPDHPHTRAAMLAQPVSSGYKLPDGWKLVPIDATRAMIDAAQRVEEDGYDAMHKAMLAAAPEGNSD